jgi:hypothetical protein
MILKNAILLTQQGKRLFKILQNITKNNGLLKSPLRNKMPFVHLIKKQQAKGNQGVFFKRIIKSAYNQMNTGNLS